MSDYEVELVDIKGVDDSSTESVKSGSIATSDCGRRPKVGDTILIGYTENNGEDYVSPYYNGSFSLAVLGANEIPRLVYHF